MVVVVGETGCGKTTQIPQYLDEAGWTQGGRVVCCTQPRRVAAATVAARVAREMGVTCGRECGYSVRFDDCTTPGVTRVRFVTDGLLVRELLRDPLLTGCAAVVVDEAHERSLQTDVLLALLRKVLWRNRTLRLIVASATLDALAFKRFFEAVPPDGLTNSAAAAAAAATGEEENGRVCVMSIEGRQHPVDVFYTTAPVADYVAAAAAACWDVHCSEPVARGDILVFLPGQDEIERAARLLRAHAHSGSHTSSSSAPAELVVLPLYAGLPYREQARVFERAPRGARKAVLATTIAETSVTIPGVAVVVDCCFARVRVFDGATGVDALVVAPVSQASAAQRAGRAGRTGPGRCLRLCREADYAALARAPVPELQRAPLAPLVLQLAAMGVADLAPRDFLAPPPPANVRHARALLGALGALDAATGRLTEPLGAQLAQLPVDPQLARMVVAAAHLGCSEDAVQIAAMMSVQHVFEATGGAGSSSSSSSSCAAAQRATVDRARRRFAVYEGDHVTYLNVFNAYLAAGGSDRWCREHGVRAGVMRKAVHVRRQLRAYCQRAGIALVARRDTADVGPLVRSIATGFFAHAAVRTPDGTYRPLRSITVASAAAEAEAAVPLVLHPDSVLCDVRPEWVVYTELVLTTRAYMRDATAVTPQLLHAVAPHFFELRQSSEARAAAAPSTTRLQ